MRTAKGPRQRTIATLVKGPEYEAEERVGWDEVVDQLSGRLSAKPARLFESTPEAPSWAEIDLTCPPHRDTVLVFESIWIDPHPVSRPLKAA